MPRGGIPISHVYADEIETQGQLSPWLQHVSDQLARQQQTVVDQSRARANMITQVNNIMSNPPRYATVDDAVQDMRERTGLDAYIKRVSNHKTASAKVRDKDGLLTRSAAKSLVSTISKPSNGKKKILRAAEVEVPESLSKYGKDVVDTLASYVKTNIETLRGMASVPQLQHDILHVWGRKYHLQSKDVDNGDVAKWLSNFIFEAQSKLPKSYEFSNVGEGVGLRDDDHNPDDDYFAGMLPANQ